MRTITIDFTAENNLPNGSILGKQGEHNATELIIKPPAEMLNYENLKHISVVFSVGTMRITSEPIEASEEIRLILSRAYTSVNVVSVQIEGYDENDNLLVKSEKFEDLIFETSIGGAEKDIDNSTPSLQNLNLNTAARHTHENNDVLDLIGQEGGNLTFNGQSIGGGSGRATGTFTTEIIHTENLSYTMIIGCYEEVPIGVEIKHIELSFDGETWKLLSGMFVEDVTPYIITNQYTAFDEDLGATILAAVYYPEDQPNWIREIGIGKLKKIRVTYYTN